MLKYLSDFLHKRIKNKIIRKFILLPFFVSIAYILIVLVFVLFIPIFLITILFSGYEDAIDKFKELYNW